MRPAVHTGVIGAVIGYLLGHWLGNFIACGYQQSRCPTQRLRDRPRLRLRRARLAGRAGRVQRPGPADAGPPAPGGAEDAEEATGLAKYFRYTLDHKVVGLQYLVGMIVYFLTGGLFAMAIRAELLSPTYHLLSPERLPRGGRRARHDDDDDDDLGHPRAVRQLPGAADDRLEAGGVPADRGAVVLAHPVRVRHPAVQPC